MDFSLAPGISYMFCTAPVLRHVLARGKEKAIAQNRAMDGCFFELGVSHPSYEIGRGWLTRIREPYAWYLRVPDLPAFIAKIAPVLERRLQASPCVGFDGELRIGFYTKALSIIFDHGKFVKAEMVKLGSWDDCLEHCQAGYPGLTFLQLLFGHRTVQELRTTFPDAWYKDEYALLFNSLFPKKASHIWPLE
jgi:hypothetical protein